MEAPRANGKIGLINLGNTCFLNAALQVLRHSKALRKNFANDEWQKHLNNKSKYAPVVTPVSELMRAIWRDDLSAGTMINLSKFYSTLVEVADKTGYDDLAIKHRQADSSEALLFILDCLHEGQAHQVRMEITGKPDNNEQKFWQFCLKKWTQHFQKQWSYIVSGFYGQTISITECSKCNNTTNSFEPWTSLKINFPAKNDEKSPTHNLSDCLADYFKDEIIDDYHCDKCAAKYPARHMTRLTIVPDNIVLILKRFTNHGTKVRDSITFDVDSIDLSQWYLGNTSQGAPTYRAIGVIDHFGGTHGGHYEASARQGDDWTHYDDTSISTTAASNIVGSNSYVIMLERK